MTIGEVPVASSSSQISVNLQKGAGEQQAAIVDKLLESTAQTAPRSAFGTGLRVNVTA